MELRMKDSAMLLMIRILPKADNVPLLAEYLRDALFPSLRARSSEQTREHLQQALEEYITVRSSLLQISFIHK